MARAAMNDGLFEQLVLKPDTRYFLYVGEIKAIGLNAFYQQALTPLLGPTAEAISIVPDVLQHYPDGNVMVINPEAARVQDETGNQIGMRIAGDRFAALVSGDVRFRRLLQRLEAHQPVVPLWLYDSRPELELNGRRSILRLAPDPELARTFNNKLWQYRHLSGVVPMPSHCICSGEKPLRRALDEMGLCQGKTVFVTQAYGAAGVGSGVVCRLDDLALCLGDPDDTYVASCYIPHTFDPTVLAVVANEHDVYVAGVADMTIEGGNKFRGSSFPSRLPQAIQKTLVDHTRRVGRTIGRLGYRGIFGCDYIVDEGGQAIFIEVNARKQGTTMEFCCTLEHLLPDGAPNLPELEVWAITQGHFPAGTVEPPPGKSPLFWETYNHKVETMVRTTAALAQAQSERGLFASAARDRTSGHVILEHLGESVQAMPGTFLARAVAVGTDCDAMRSELSRAKEAIGASCMPLGN